MERNGESYSQRMVYTQARFWMSLIALEPGEEAHCGKFSLFLSLYLVREADSMGFQDMNSFSNFS